MGTSISTLIADLGPIKSVSRVTNTNYAMTKNSNRRKADHNVRYRQDPVISQSASSIPCAKIVISQSAPILDVSVKLMT